MCKTAMLRRRSFIGGSLSALMEKPKIKTFSGGKIRQTQAAVQMDSKKSRDWGTRIPQVQRGSCFVGLNPEIGGRFIKYYVCMIPSHHHHIKCLNIRNNRAQGNQISLVDGNAWKETEKLPQPRTFVSTCLNCIVRRKNSLVMTWQGGVVATSKDG